MLCRLDDFCLAMIEQPLPPDDLVGHAMVQETMRTPVCLDEGIASPAQAEMALDLHSCKYVNLKPGRVGGLTAAVAIHNACHEHCVPCWVGAMPQSAIGGAVRLRAGRQGQLHLSGRFLSLGSGSCAGSGRTAAAGARYRRHHAGPIMVRGGNRRGAGCGVAGEVQDPACEK